MAKCMNTENRKNDTKDEMRKTDGRMGGGGGWVDGFFKLGKARIQPT